MLRRRHRFSIDAAFWRAAGASLVLFAVLLVATIPAPALAHHGWSGYDSSTLLTLTGTITDVQYGNPHVMVTLAVPQEEEEHAEGEVHAEGAAHEEAEIVDPPSVTVVMAPPFRSESRGLSRDMLYPGATATFEGYLHRTTEMELRAERIIIGDLTVELR
jgi:hypothetical protein